MNPIVIQIAAITNAFIFTILSIYQVLLVLGIPIGEASWGGQYKVLPVKFRIGSAISVFILSFSSIVFLQYGNIISTIFVIPWENIIVWIITIYMGLNTFGNFCSKSKYEKLIMTPITIIAFLAGLIVAIFE